MTWCLIKKEADKFIKMLRSGEIDPAKLVNMSSAERRKFFEQFGKENAQKINALFESKLLLKNQKAGMITWAKQISNLSQRAKMDIISRINRLDKVLNPGELEPFLEDLAAQKLNVGVTREEGKKIFDLAQNTEKLLAKIPEGAPVGSKERLEYGLSKITFEKYLQELKKGSPSISTWFKNYAESPSSAIFDLAGTTKSMLATLDNSFFGRQGIKTLFTNPEIWGKAFLKSWSDIGKGLLNIDATDMIKADIMSRPNALNGKYDLMKLDISGITEEAFPTSIPERIPGFGRLFKASENAFTGAALRVRSDLADKFIKLADSQGINTLDKAQMDGMGKLVNSMTGRGSIGKLGVMGKEINVAFFSIKFLKSNIDTLFGGVKNIIKYPLKRKTMTFAERKSVENIIRIVGGITAILSTAEMLWPDSVEKDPRSTDFGKIKIGDTRFDVTGGMGSLAVLSSRIIPTKHDGEWGFWVKSSSSGKMIKLNTGKYGARTALDVIDDFWKNKLSPLAGLLRDVWKGEHFAGEKITAKSILKNLTVPLTVQNSIELMKEPNSAPVIITIMLETLGIGTNTYGESKPKIKPIK